MTKFQKIQQYLGIIPFVPTIFIFVISIIELKRNKAGKIAWVKLFCGLAAAIASIVVLNTVIMTGENPFLNVLASGLLCWLANLWFVHLQCKCTEQNHNAGISVPPIKKDIIILVALLVLFLSFVFGNVIWRLAAVVIEHNEKTIADTNGATDFSLQTITEQEIVATSFGGTQIYWSSTHEGNQSDISDAFEDRFIKELDYDKIRTKAQEFSGVDDVHATKTNSQSLTLTIKSTVTEGNFAIVIVVDGSFYCSVDINQTKSITLDDIAGKTVLVKIAGESAEYQIEVERTYDN